MVPKIIKKAVDAFRQVLRPKNISPGFNSILSLSGVIFFSLALLIFVPGKAACQNSGNENQVDLKVLSWNIYMLPFLIKHTGKRKRAAAIGDQLAQSDYDILIFQEAFHHGARRRLKRRLKNEFPFRTGPVFKRPIALKVSSGLWVMSKMPLETLGTVKFKEKYGFDNKLARKGAILVEGEKGGEDFQILATHLNSGGPFHVRQSQLDQMRFELLDPFTENGTPQIICGDMNIVRERKEEYEAMLNTLDAEDAESFPFTYDGQLNPLTSGSHQVVIDYIFIRENGNGIEIIQREIPEIRCPWSEKTDYLSDHHPVMIHLKLK